LFIFSRYGKVIVVVGMNPDKDYLVSPYQRAELVRRMLDQTPANNVRVEGMFGYNSHFQQSLDYYI
jgi:phosphopantetheine adenylyltransferase